MNLDMRRIHRKPERVVRSRCCTGMDNGLLEVKDREKPNRTEDSGSRVVTCHLHHPHYAAIACSQTGSQRILVIDR